MGDGAAEAVADLSLETERGEGEEDDYKVSEKKSVEELLCNR